MRKIRIIVCLMLICCSGLYAQDFVRYKFRHISPLSGLSGIYVRKIIQDPYGFLWIGTQDGLNRYDGKNFIIYNKGFTSPRSLTGLDIRDLLLDTADHLIWEINSYGGIDAIDYISGRPLYQYFQEREPSVKGVLFTSLTLLNHHLYIGSSNGLYVMDTREKRLRKVDLSDPFYKGQTPLAIDKMLSDPSGNIWLFCRARGVLLLREKSLVPLDAVGNSRLGYPEGSDVRFFDCMLLKDGRILTATSSGLRAFSAGSNGRINVCNDPFPGIPVSQGRNIYSCRQDRKGNIWFSTPNYLIRIAGPRETFCRIREHTSRDEFNWLQAVYGIFIDQEDNLWLGCQQGLAYTQNSPSCFTSISHSAVSTTSIRQAYYINVVNDDIVYCCAQEGLYEVHPATGAIRPLGRNKPYYHAFRDPYGRLIASSIDGVFCISRDRFIPLAKVYGEFLAIGQVYFNSHCAVGDSLIIFGTENDKGIVAWNYKKHTALVIDRRTSGFWLKENTVNTLYKDRSGKIWVLGDTTISILDIKDHTTKSLNTYNTALKKFYYIFFDLCEVMDRYYLASYGEGVVVLDKEHHIVRELSVKDGLAANTVYKVLPYRDSLLLVTSNNGLSVINIRNNYRIRNFYENDGLHSDNFEENSGAIGNNTLYAGGSRGLTAIDPSAFPAPSSPPQLYLRQVKIETRSGLIDTSNLLLTSLEIPSNALQTTLYFSSISYANPTRSAFAYRIKELKGNWIEVGSQDFINLIGMGPGKYTLQVRSANENGRWNEHPLTLSLIVLPKWYQTLWFRIMVIISISALLYAFYRYRIRQIRRQQEIRKEIASDLHDDIGSILNTVKIFTHLARKERQKEDHLIQIEESLTQASTGLRDMIWVLDDSGDTIRDLCERIKKFAIPITTANAIHFECQVGEGMEEESLSKTEKRNLLLIVKESVNNSIKYGECRNIRIRIQEVNNKLHLSIRDDGKGFDIATVTAGYGLKNIIQRARQIGFAAKIDSTPGGGTAIVINR